MKNGLITKNEKKKPLLNPLQKTFNVRKKRIETLQKECLACAKALDKHLDIYVKEIVSRELSLAELTKQVIKVIAPYLSDKKNFSKSKRDTLNSLIINLFEKSANLTGPAIELDEELSQIYKKTRGSSYKEEQSSEFEEFKDQMEGLFKQQGLDLDLSDIKMEGSQEEILAKLFASIEDQNAFAGQEKKENIHTKNKKQIEKEEKALEKAALQKKEISMIYKQLAKVFHPDLEQNPIIKLEKEVLMKKLTVAYEAGDLHTILALEIETLNISDSLKKARTDEQFKIYNQLLQSQIEMLQSELNSIPYQYKYNCLYSYTHYYWKSGDDCLGKIQQDIDQQLKIYNGIVKEEKKISVIATVRSMIEEFEMTEQLFDFDFIFDDF